MNAPSSPPPPQKKPRGAQGSDKSRSHLPEPLSGDEIAPNPESASFASTAEPAGENASADQAPSKASNPPAKKPTTKKPPAKKPPVKKPPAKKAPAKNASAKDLPAKKPPVTKPPVGKAPAENPTATAQPAKTQPPVEGSLLAGDVDADIDGLDAVSGDVEAVIEIDGHDTVPERNETAPEQTEVDSADQNGSGHASDTPALVLRGLTKRYGETRAVDRVDLTVPAGSFYGLVGPNGAGKTTTLSMIAGLVTADAGSITVSGIDMAAEPIAAKRVMGVLPDRLRTFDRLTGRQLLYYYGVLRGLTPPVVERRTADLARAFDLAEALGRPVSDYSVGMTKKVLLAGALIHSPRVLVLDEPFESVDPASSAVLLEILTDYVDHGGTVLLSSHGMDLVERVCTRVAVIVAGAVLADGTIDQVRGDLTLEQRYAKLTGSQGDGEGLGWLHTFSG